ncbi:hypothetical protein OVA26_16130 [Microbacterium sp. SL62]|uniref:hypothetical protein n=1 Tax=Microbacterium sp. SL62 TaxID=2995139 RepID=UPI00227685EB|nr:hypothetical protein [Microbacterium sp. SL62]MCY1718464.1 hypothetical protein [Microbacterium sp. SL62]
MRDLWFMDRYGDEIEEGITVQAAADLLRTIENADGDEEHRAVTVCDSDGWSLEYYPESVRFDNVHTPEKIGRLRGLSHDQRVALAEELIRGDFATLRSHPWESLDA